MTVLPTKFLGFLPLYVGVEVILALAILNKLSGLYGILSIFTGHPLGFVQWLLYITSILFIPLYAIGLKDISKPKVLEHAALLSLYSIDTLMTFFFIVYFVLEWFINEDVTTVEIEGQDYSKSASQTFEYGWIITTTLAVSIARIYFNLTLLSFYKKLVKVYKIQGLDVIENDVDLDLKNKIFYKRWLFQFEKLCFGTLERYKI